MEKGIKKEKGQELESKKEENLRMGKVNKKILFGVVGLVIVVAVIILLLILSKQQGTNIMLKDGTVLDNATCARLEKVIVIHEAGCPACAVALPRLRELEQELNLSFSYYDIAINKDREKIVSLGVIPVAVPTLVANCKVYVGAKSKEEFKSIITS
jgi:thiol-disulfide isomerase/thioredoxin